MFKKSFYLTLLSLFLCNNLSALTYVYSHGLGDAGVTAAYYTKGHSVTVQVDVDGIMQEANIQVENPNESFYIFGEPIHHFNYPHAHKVGIKKYPAGFIGLNGKTFRPHIQLGIADSKKVSLGQHIEIDTLKKEIEHIKDDCILFGRSMGAATIINYLATYKPTNIKAVILEAPYDCIENVIWSKIGPLQWLGLGKAFTATQYPQYNSNGIKPSKCIHTISTDIPVLFVHSKKDSLIPVSCSRGLYKNLKKMGHKKVYLLELNNADHNDATTSSDANMYQRVVHAFYKEYGLPYDADLAGAGLAQFTLTQPSLAEIASR